MTINTGPNLGLMADGLIGEAHYLQFMAALRGFDGMVQPRVKDKDLTTPPGSPANGDMYIPAPGATGAWAPFVGRLVRWFTAQSVASSWESYVPKKGWRVHVEDENVDYQHNGTTWVITSAGVGNVVGPASAVDNQIALFDGVTGKLLKAGSVVGTAAYKNTGTSGDAVPLLNVANTFSAQQTIDANLVITGTARRLQGDFSNSNIFDRTCLQTSVTDGNTTMVFIPNGTSQIANVQFLGGTTAALGSRGIVGINGIAAEFTFDSTNTGGIGAILPMKFKVGGGTFLTIATSGSSTFGGPVVYAPYTLATLPDPVANVRGNIWVSNLTSGAEPCSSDGINWRQYSTRAVAS